MLRFRRLALGLGALVAATLAAAVPGAVADSYPVNGLVTLDSTHFRIHFQANYGEEALQQEPSPLPQTNLVQLAEDIVCTKNNTRWEEVKSYSNRQKRLMPISGFVGRLHFRGDLAPFHELLAWGELVHIGKSAVKGNGWYKVLSPPISS